MKCFFFDQKYSHRRICGSNFTLLRLKSSVKVSSRFSINCKNFTSKNYILTAN